MTAPLRVILISCLLQGILCQDWVAFMPPSIEVLSGSCVSIPCNFLLGPGWDSYLDSSCKAIWRRGWRRTRVFDSSLTGANAISNTFQGNLTGNLLQKDCTTIFNNVPYHYSDYFFRLECDNNLKFSYGASVNINAKDTLPRPTITPSRVEVEEGTSVRLTCTAAVPCPILPPTLTWTTGLGDIEEKIQSQLMTSNLTFVASHLHHGQKLSCTALYKRPSGNSDLSLERSLNINVLYPPNNTSVSPTGPVLEGRTVTLTCSSNANPAVESYTWYGVDGDQVTSVGFRRMLSIKVSEHNSQFYCEAKNKYGTQNSSVIQIDVQFPPKDTSVSVSPFTSVPEGGTVTLTCSSKANPAVTNYTWYRVDGDSKDMVEYRHGQTFTLDGADPSHSGNYYCEARNDHGEDISTPGELDIYHSPKNTSVSVSPSGPVPEGSSVTLTCSSKANPAVENYTWYRVEGGEKEAIGFEKDVTFNVTKLSSDEYYCQAQNIHGVHDSEPISIDVTFAPVILTSSGCIRILSQIRCSCESHGNPPPSLQWELAGESVNGSDDITIKDLLLSSTVLRSLITLREVVDEEMPTLACLSTNKMGFDSFTFNMSSIETQPGVHTTSLLIGSAVGAVAMMLLCVVMEIICRKKNGRLSPKIGLKETSEPLATIEATVPQVEAIYANKAMLVVGGGDDGDTVHGGGDGGDTPHGGGDDEDDTVHGGGDGEDTVHGGGDGGATLHGGGDDEDTVHGGGDGGATLHGGGYEEDTVHGGGDGGDTVHGGGDDEDTVHGGGDGGDTVHGGGDDEDTVHGGGDGGDTVHGGGDDEDTVHGGGDGGDTVHGGGDGGATLHGGGDDGDTLHGGGDGGDTLHYASVDFARSEGQCEEGEVRGLASKTDEYAELHLNSEGCSGVEAEMEEMVADTASAQGSGMNDQRVQADEQAIAIIQGDGNGVITETKDTGLPEQV